MLCNLLLKQLAQVPQLRIYGLGGLYKITANFFCLIKHCGSVVNPNWDDRFSAETRLELTTFKSRPNTQWIGLGQQTYLGSLALIYRR